MRVANGVIGDSVAGLMGADCWLAKAIYLSEEPLKYSLSLSVGLPLFRALHV